MRTLTDRAPSRADTDTRTCAWGLGLWLCAALLGCGHSEGRVFADAPPVAAHDAAVASTDGEDAGGFMIGVDGGLAVAERCDKHSDCTWVESRCACWLLERADVTAVNKRWASRFSLTCSQRCAVLPSPYLVPRCVAGRCEVMDVREQPASQCKTVADCALRVRECCECGGNADATAVIALARDQFADYQALVCDDATPSCDACAVTYPPTEGLGLIAQLHCNDAHCSVEAVRIEPQ